MVATLRLFAAVAIVLAASPASSQRTAEMIAPDLAAHGITVEGSYVWDLAGPASGAESALWFGQGLFDLILGYERASAFGTFGAVLDLQAHHGADPSLLAGDLQAFDNQGAEGFERIAEFFVELSTRAERLRVKAGKMDANGEFAAPDNAGDFVNSSMGFSPTIAGMSSYPDNGFGAVVAVEGPSALSLRAGVFDAGERSNPDGLEMSFEDVTFMVEANRSWEARGGGRLGLGWWQLTADGVDADGNAFDAIDGVYLTFDQTLWMPDGDTRGRGLSVFGQWAHTPDGVVEIDDHAGAGLLWTGPWTARFADAVGLGWTRAGVDPRYGFTASAEAAYEVFYRAQVTSQIAVQPDLQFVTDPGGDAEADAVVATTLRVIATF